MDLGAGGELTIYNLQFTIQKENLSSDPIEIPIGPEMDLHAFHPRDIPSVVHEYVIAAHSAGLVEVRLVHGRGRGVQRGIVQAVLERHPLVVSFWDDPSSHLGATVAQLRGR